MKHKRRFLLVVAGIATSVLSADATQSITNTVTVSMTLAFQQGEGENAKAFFVPAPRIQQYTTTDLIAQMSKSFPTISTNRGTVLQAVSVIDNTNNEPVIFRVRNTNGTITDVSSVLSITAGTNNVYSYTALKTTGVLNGANLGLSTISYDDTATTTNNSTNGIRLNFNGVTTTRYSITPTQIPGTYNFRQTGSQVGATGEGLMLGVGTNAFIVTRATYTVTGTGTYTPPEE